MFYFLEIYYRIFFLFVFNTSFFFILYFYKELLIWIIIFPFNFNKKFQNHFIYTHPTELFNTIFYLIFFICLIVNLIYIIVILLDFFKTSLIKSKFIFFQKLIVLIFVFCFSFNLIFIFYLIPFVFFFFESYNTTENVNLDLIMELRIESYIKFFIEYLILSNFIFYFIILLLLFIFLFKFILFLKNKKFIVLINILLSTLFSPPDIFSQLTIFFILSFLIELLFLTLLFKLKFNKVTY